MTAYSDSKTFSVSGILEQAGGSRMPRKPKRIALLHHAGCGNLGDDAIIDAVVSNIRRRWDNAEIAVFSMNPDDSAKRHGITSFPIRRYRWDSRPRSAITQATQPDGHKLGSRLRNTRIPAFRVPRAAFGELAFLAQSYRRLKSFDLLIVSGGGQLTERGGPWSFPWALLVWSIMAKCAGVRFVLLNVGAGPLNHLLSRFFVRRALRRAEYVSFRDKQSQDHAAELGIAGKGTPIDHLLASRPCPIRLVICRNTRPMPTLFNMISSARWRRLWHSWSGSPIPSICLVATSGLIPLQLKTFEQPCETVIKFPRRNTFRWDPLVSCCPECRRWIMSLPADFTVSYSRIS